MSQDIANTPPAPYYAVIFTSLRTAVDEGYGDMAEKMVALAAQQPGFLGVKDLESIRAWKANAEHQIAQKLGHEKWYAAFKTRIAKVERDYAL
jgi:heme-degrading monooxygenase HmoA